MNFKFQNNRYFSLSSQNLSVRLEEVEANAVVGARRAISKLEAHVRDMELELESEKKNHAETIKILRKKERTVKEIIIQCEEDQKNVLLLQEQLDKANARLGQYKRQLSEQVRWKWGLIKVDMKINGHLLSRRVFQSNRSPAFVVYSANWRPQRSVPMSPRAA
jgi:hypothetical protein